MNKINYLSDTNIFIKLYHAYNDSTILCELYVRNFSTLGFVEPVHHEIMRTPSSKNSKKLSLKVLYKRLDNEYEIIFIDELEAIVKQSYINEMRNFGYTDYKGCKNSIKDIGEKGTLLISHLLDIPIIHSDDYHFVDFVEMNRDRFPDVELFTLNSILEVLVPEHKERISINKNIEINSKRFNVSIEQERAERNMQKRLEKLYKKFNKH